MNLTIIIILGLGFLLISLTNYLQYKYWKHSLYGETYKLRSEMKELKTQNENELKYFLSRLNKKDHIIINKDHEIERNQKSKEGLEQKIKELAEHNKELLDKIKIKDKKIDSYKHKLYRREGRLEKLEGCKKYKRKNTI